MRILIFFLINLLSYNLLAQDGSDWLNPTKRDANYPQEEYWRHFHKLEFNKKIDDSKKRKKEKEGLNQAKAELSKKITSSVNTQSQRKTIREKDIYNSMFKMSTDVSSSVTFTDLKQEIVWGKKNRTCYIFLYVKKADLQTYWTNSYEYMTNTIAEKVRSCSNIFYNIRNDQESLKMAENIDREIKIIDALQELLSLFTKLNYDAYNAALNKDTL